MKNLTLFENWRNSPAFNQTIETLNEKDIDYLAWTDIDIYKWYLKNIK